MNDPFGLGSELPTFQIDDSALPFDEPDAGGEAAFVEAPPEGVAAPPAMTAGIAFITVTDASGRVLFRRPATAEEVGEALRAADGAEREGEAAMGRIIVQRQHLEDNHP